MTALSRSWLIPSNSLIENCRVPHKHLHVVSCGLARGTFLVNNGNSLKIPSINRTCAHAETTKEVPATVPQREWDRFATATSGEWSGVTATFDENGKPQALPQYYVPDAYAEWGVVLYDWQSQCSTKCDRAGLSYTHRRMMPTVGCEADAVAYTSEQLQLFRENEQNIPIMSDGSYIHSTWNLSSLKASSATVEQCLPLHNSHRVRIVHTLQMDGENKAWQTESIDVHHEHRDGPYNGRIELQGCGGGMETFAEQPPLNSSSLKAEWTVIEGVLLSYNDQGCIMKEESTAGQVRCWEEQDAVYLPLELWTSVTSSPEVLTVVAGALLSDTIMRTARIEYRRERVCSVCFETLLKI